MDALAEVAQNDLDRPIEEPDGQPFGNMAEAVAEAMDEIWTAYLERMPASEMGRA